MTTIPQTDIDYLAQFPSNQICLIVSGMTALLQDTEEKVSAMQSQNWFQRMAKTVSGKNRLTAEDIRKNHDKLNAYMAEAITVLYNMNKIDQAVILSLGAQLNDVYADQIRLKEQLGAFIVKLNDKIDSVDNFHMLITEIEQGVYSTCAPLVGITLVLSQFDNRMLSDMRKLDIIKRSLIGANIIDSRGRSITEYLSDLMEISEENAGRVYLEWGAIRGNYIANILSTVIESYYYLPEMVRKLKKKDAILNAIIQAEGLDDSITLSIEEIYDDFLSSKINNIRVALPAADVQTSETPDTTCSKAETNDSDNTSGVSAPDSENLEIDFEQLVSEQDYVAAKNGDAYAQYLVGLSYECGLGVEQDIEEAVKWYTRAAAQGLASAQCSLGSLYIAGEDVEKDECKGAELLRSAAVQGDTEAQRMLGTCYAEGCGVLKSMKTANEWFLKAANQEDAEAQCLLGKSYLEGKGVDMDEAEGVRWLQKAVEQDYPEAQITLGICYEIGVGVEKDLYAAFRLYNEAAEAGNLGAQTRLGICYEQGKGTEQDLSEAVRWYKRAVEQNGILAHVYLSNCYMFGKGVSVDYKEANELLGEVVEYTDEPYIHHLYAMSIYALYALPCFKILTVEDGIIIPGIKDYPMFPKKNSDRGIELMKLASLEKTDLGKEMMTHLKIASDSGYYPSKACLIGLKYRPIM